MGIYCYNFGLQYNPYSQIEWHEWTVAVPMEASKTDLKQPVLFGSEDTCDKQWGQSVIWMQWFIEYLESEVRIFAFILFSVQLDRCFLWRQ